MSIKGKECASNERVTDVRARRALSRGLIIVLLACAINFGLRYYYAFEYMDVDGIFHQIGGDAEDFLRIAYTLSQADSFAEPTRVDVKQSLLLHQHPPEVPSADLRETAWRPPLWPLVLAGMMRVTGYDLFYMLYLRFLIDSLTIILFYGLLLRLKLHTAVASWQCCCSPSIRRGLSIRGHSFPSRSRCSSTSYSHCSCWSG